MNSNTNTAVNFYWENIGFHNLHCDSKLSCDVRLCPWEWLESQPLPVEAAIVYPVRQKHLLWKRQGRRSLENKVSALPDPPVRRTLLAAFKASLVISAGCAHLHVIFPLRLALSLGSLTWGNTALSGSLLWELHPAASTSPVAFYRILAGPCVNDITAFVCFPAVSAWCSCVSDWRMLCCLSIYCLVFAFSSGLIGI